MTDLFYGLFVVFVIIVAVAGWATHILWAFATLMGSTFTAGTITLAVLGTFIPFIGSLHGVYLWFT